MRAGVVIPFVVAIGLGGAAAMVGKDMINQRTGPGSQGSPVLVAARDLDAGVEVAEKDLTVSMLPPGSVPPTAVTRKSDAVGRVVAVGMPKGQIIYDAALAPRSAGTGYQALVPPGMRAVNLEFTDSGVARMLSPGCRVDVIAAFTDESTHETVAKAIVENARVTQVRSPAKGDNVVSHSVMLVVSAREAVALELAAARGKPRLVLRGRDDTEAVAGGAMSASDMAGLRTGVPPPGSGRSDPGAGNPIHVIRGSNQSTVIVDQPPPAPRGPVAGGLHAKTVTPPDDKP